MDALDTPQISRSGRVLKKSAKVKEMEDFDINELDLQGKPRKKLKTMDDSDEFDDKRVAPIKIPKISLNIPSTTKKKVEMQQAISKMTFQSQMKGKQDIKRSLYMDSDASKESDSSSVSSESSSSSSTSSDDSDGDVPDMRQRYMNVDVKSTLLQNLQHITPPQEKVIVKAYQPFDSPVSFVDHNSEMPPESEDEASDSALVIAEESNDLPTFGGRGQSGMKKMPLKTETSYGPKRVSAPKRKPPNKNAKAAKPAKPAGKSKPLTAYMLWCTENRKRVAASMGNITGFGNIVKKLGETWQALPDKEKMAWKRKAKRLALKNSGGLISTGPTNGASPKSTTRSVSSSGDEISRGLTESTGSLGTTAIDAAAYLKLLGDSLSVIGQRLTEHEGQLAVSGIFSVLLDTILCVVGPLLCLTSESPVLNSCPPETFAKTLDSIAYFMPGL